ncbi:phosphotransferase family protein [Sphingomonas immobilis]|uniref:Phosphotransferase family protein n=1 Tax=Sphingomonas immobilis TaxID=3063997 RepID=A0ABT8ZX46_9SPHN|nr:phosphotransferase family protein [Sphingomonas sp. CA1-15]MDO7842138.1 phosphotransferase family protein [Sphingomonas sp. CA1-15]
MNSPAAAAPGIVAPNTRNLEDLANDMAGWLTARLPGARDVTVSNLSYPLGAGMSHETILFDAAWRQDGTARQQGLVVRIKPTRHLVYQDDMFDEQYRLMRVMHEDGRVKVAHPLWFEPSPELLGAPFFVMERLQGRVAVSLPPYAETGWVADATPAQRRTLWENSVRQLAAIQTIPVSAAPFLDPADGPHGFDHEWDRWQRYLAWLPEDHATPFLREASGALDKTRPQGIEPGIVWGDSRLGNVMIDADFGVVAVMDWEQTSLGGALHDLGWWLHTERMQTIGRGLPPLDGMGTHDETRSLWSEVCGKQTADIAWYEAFAAFKMACLTRRMMALGAQIAVGRHGIDTPNNRRMADLLGMSIPAA